MSLSTYSWLKSIKHTSSNSLSAWNWIGGSLKLCWNNKLYLRRLGWRTSSANGLKGNSWSRRAFMGTRAAALSSSDTVAGTGGAYKLGGNLLKDIMNISFSVAYELGVLKPHSLNTHTWWSGGRLCESSYNTLLESIWIPVERISHCGMHFTQKRHNSQTNDSNLLWDILVPLCNEPKCWQKICTSLHFFGTVYILDFVWPPWKMTKSTKGGKDQVNLCTQEAYCTFFSKLAQKYPPLVNY